LLRSRTARGAVALVAAGACACAAAPAQAAEQHAYAAAYNYATPVVTMGRGDSLVFNNLDTTARHDLVSDDGKFSSTLVGGGESAPVNGAQSLDPGTYKFHCSLHSWMHGVLEVGEQGGAVSTPSPESTMLPTEETPDPADIFPPASAQPLTGGDWRQYGRDATSTRDGGSAGPSPADVLNLGVVWSFWSHMGDFTSTPAVADGKVFAGSSMGTVYSLDAVTGKPLWAHKIGQPVNGSVAVDAGKVLVPVAQVNGPRLVALSEKSGRVLWDTTIDTQKDSDVYGSPSVWNGMVYLGQSAEYGETNDPNVSTRGSVTAVDERTGKIRWKTFTVSPGHDGGAVWTTPAVDGQTGRLYVGTGNAYHAPAADTTDSVLALDARTGRTLAHYQATSNDVWNETNNAVGVDYDFGSSPNLFTGPGGQKLVGMGQKAGDYWAFDRTTLQPVWHTKTTVGTPSLGGIVGSTATDGKRVYGPDTIGGEAWALDTSGHLSWASADGGPLHFNPTTVSNGVVYTSDMTGFLTARDAATGVPLLKIPLGSPAWGGVAVAGGSIFADTGSQGSSGYLVAYRKRTGHEAQDAAHHWDEAEMPWFEDPATAAAKKRHATRHHRRHARKRAKRSGVHHAKKRKRHRHKPRRDQQGVHPAIGDDPNGTPPIDPYDPMMGPGGGPTKALRQMADRWVPKPPGTTQHLSLYYGPFTVPPGQDFNRVDLDLPMYDGWLQYVAPYMRRVEDLSEPSHQVAHIHHAHWYRANPGDPTDNYLRGNAEWIFGQGDEQTHADFRQRSAADPNGPYYGEFIPKGDPQGLIYMLHNKTNQPINVYIVLDAVFTEGTGSQLEQITHRPWHDLQGMLMGRTYDVPRNPNGDGHYLLSRDAHHPVTWTSPVDGTLVGIGGHLHPGGEWLNVTNQGSESNPCPTTPGNTVPGTLMIHEGVIPHIPAAGDFSEDYQTETTHPAWRAPIHKGDRIVLDSSYENRDHAWYVVMTHEGFYFDTHQAPQGRCKPYMVGGWAKRWKNPTKGVPNRRWRMDEAMCGIVGYPPCDHPDTGSPPTPVHTNEINISNFTYQPGDRAASGLLNVIPWIRQGEKITFVNEDWALGIRHSATSCAWPCNGRYVSNYPLADGRFDSGILGWDPISEGNPTGVSTSPADLAPGKYAYFCRIHPWMRGAFEVVPKDAPAPTAGSPLLASAPFVAPFGLATP
jgi:polyvinyl alcohol dehydrogenase (cytochrome)